jgi:hypothetical protein
MTSKRNSSHQIPSSRRSLILDPIHPRDFRELAFTYSCEQCSHFDETNEACTIGYDARKHRQADQLRLYDLTGRMAFCRFMEID